MKKAGKKGKSKICAKDGCGALIDESKKCSRCRLVYYCSRDCQRADWKVHKPKCNATVEEKAAQDARAKKQSRPRAAREDSGSGAGIRTDESAEKGAAEEECPICFDLLVDPLSPCPEQLAHQCCRVCVEKMREHGLPACPLCRAPMQDAKELFYGSVQLQLRAKRAVGEAKAGLQRQHFDMLRRVLEVDPHHAKAMFNLGIIYYRGVSVEKDAVQSSYWYRKAAEQGMAEAQYNLGVNYFKGKGVEKDAVQAVYWYRKAAVQGYAVAQYNLGLKYGNGEGVEKDAAQAVHWYRKAAVQDDAQAKCNAEGVAAAQFNLGWMYDNGEGVEKDQVRAVHFFRKAAVQGHAVAQYNLGSMYRKGEGVKKDAVQAVHWYRKAAVQGDADAQTNLGVMYIKGEGVQQNSHEAASWWQKAADQGDVSAHSNLGKLNEQQGEYEAALVHYRAGQAAKSPEEAHNRIRRCVEAVVRAKQQQ
jgi:TPR repeat protein